MRLLSCHIENFGILHDLRLHFEEDLTPVLERNGWGKTTLAAFLTAMFYGLPSKGHRGTPGPRALYMPWNGGTFGGTILFEAGGKIYRLVRAFGETPKKDTFLLYDERTGYESEDFPPQIGEALFGIDRESFVRTASFRSADPLAGTTPQIQARIGGITPETDDLSEYEKAIGRLAAEERRLSPERSSGELNKMSRELDLLAKEAGRTAAAAEQVREASRQLHREQQLHRSLVKEQETLLTQSTLAEPRPQTAEPQEAVFSDHAAKTLRETRHRRDDVRSELALSEARLETFRKMALILSSAAGILILCALLTVLIPETPPLLVTGLFLAGAVLGSICAAGSFVKIRQLSSSIDLLRDTDRALSRKLRRLRRLRQQSEATPLPEKTVQTAPVPEQAPLSPAQAERLREISRQLDSSRMQEMLLADRLKEARSELSGCENAAARREALLADYETLQEEYLVCTQTARFMRQARETLSVRCMDPFRSALLKYYCTVTDTPPDAVRADASLDVVLTMDGIPRDPSSLSDGMRDLLGFCRRMAILDAMYPENKPFLLMDDPFSGLDDEHLLRALRLVRRISETWQVLYFTCHTARLP